jgi:acetyltransferase EpsM
MGDTMIPFNEERSPSAPYDAPNSLVIYGGGGHGKAIIELVRALGIYQLVGVVDDVLPVGGTVLGLPVLGGASILPALADQGIRQAVNAVGGIGNVAERLNVFDKIAQAGLVCPALVHPTAYVEASACLEGGIQILAQSYISSEARIGFGTVINAGVVVSHDCMIGRVVNLSPGAMLAGGVILEDFVQVGMGATINLGIRIGKGARIGNSATVKKDVPARQVVRAGTIWPIYDPALSARKT